MKKTVYLVITAVLLLIITSFIISDFIFLGLNIKKINLFSDFLPAFEINPVDTAVEKYENNFLMMLSDSLDFESDSNFFSGNNQDFLEFYGQDSSLFLLNFFESLKKTERDGTKTRVAFLGDSMIEGDLVSQTFRYKLQKKFGGSGVGYVPLTSTVSGFRKSIKHSFSRNWRTYSLISDGYFKKFGLSGYVFVPQIVSKKSLADSASTDNQSWVYFESPQNSYDNLKEFYTIKLYYSSTDNFNYVNFIGKTNKYFILGGEDIVNELVLNDSNTISELKLYFNTASRTDFHGISFESASGIFVDNYALRGNTGLPLVNLDKDVLKAQNKYFNYSLIILQYGLNVVAPESKYFDWYKNDMVKTVSFFKECFPQADIIIMSVSDKCYRKNGCFLTEPSIPIMVGLQQETAKESGVVFWNLFESMGGVNSMYKWVNANPPLANKDFTHFNSLGAEKIGTFFYKQLLRSYIKFRNKK
ncbi:MAG: hypothetical protein JW917_03165 [Ignavibacteria bacterium]|nr:hypothetical protein [Ignavibacteria bacterium]